GLQPGLAFVLASALSAGQVILMKWLVLRPGPVTALFEGLGSFPSGHAANAAVIATFGGLLIGRPWMWAAGAAYVVLVAASRVVLITVVFVAAIITLKGGFAALVVIGYLVWLWFALRRFRSRRRR